MNTVDFNCEVEALTDWLCRSATRYQLAHLLAAHQLKPQLLNGQNRVCMKEAGLELKTDLRQVVAKGEARRANGRRHDKFEKADRKFRAALKGSHRMKGIAP